MAGRRITVLVAVLVLVVDQASKLWAVAALTGREPIPLLGRFLQLRLLYNPGAVLSFGSGATPVLAVIAAAAAVVIWRLAGRDRSRDQAVALGLLLGGAVTHLADRLFRGPGFGFGKVVDFIDYDGWFVGNLADVALTCGVVVLIVGSLLRTDRSAAGGLSGGRGAR